MAVLSVCLLRRAWILNSDKCGFDSSSGPCYYDVKLGTLLKPFEPQIIHLWIGDSSSDFTELVLRSNEIRNENHLAQYLTQVLDIFRSLQCPLQWCFPLCAVSKFPQIIAFLLRWLSTWGPPGLVPGISIVPSFCTSLVLSDSALAFVSLWSQLYFILLSWTAQLRNRAER